MLKFHYRYPRYISQWLHPIPQLFRMLRLGSWSVLLIAAFSCSDLVMGDVEEFPVVQISNGPVMGRVFTSTWTTKTVYAFTGIPYAAPPVSNLRFKDPTLPQNWTDTLDCTVEAPWCIQNPMAGEQPSDISEDCLYLNVYSPQINVASGALWPVMVWVHGGGWLAGSGSYALYGPDMLLAEGVVVVTLNYRLGAFGFLSLGVAEAPGNSGLKDQVLALRWVQQEIEKFGGDPNQVTLAGESAGATSVHLHYLSPLSRGLFQRAIGESGTALTNAARVDHAPYGMKLAEMLNCSTAGATSALQCLQSKSADDILNYQSKVTSGGFQEQINGNSSTWRANVDQTLSSEPFLPAMPLELYDQGQGSFVPFLMGSLRDDGTFKLGSSDDFIKNITNNLVYLIPEEVRKASSKKANQQKVQNIKDLYFGDTIPSTTNITGFLHMYTDYLVTYLTTRCARMFRSRARVYLYEFLYDGQFKEPACIADEDTFNISLVCHGEEMNYLFVVKGVNQTTVDEEEMTTWRRMARMWTNFIKYGTPTPSPSDSLLQDVFWSTIGTDNSIHLNIDKDLTVAGGGPRGELWDSVFTVSSSLRLQSKLTLVSAVLSVLCMLK